MALSKFTIVLNPAEIEQLTNSPDGEVATKILSEGAQIVVRGAHIRAPIRTGKLYDSIGWQPGHDGDGLFVEIYAEFYDKFLERPAKQIKHAKRTLRNAVRDLPRIL